MTVAVDTDIKKHWQIVKFISRKSSWKFPIFPYENK